MSLNALDAQIARLEAELNASSSDEEDDSDEDSEEEEEEEEVGTGEESDDDDDDDDYDDDDDHPVIMKDEKKRVLATALSEDDIIAPLPSHCLPAKNMVSSAVLEKRWRREQDDADREERQRERRVPSTFTTKSEPTQSKK